MCKSAVQLRSSRRLPFAGYIQLASKRRFQLILLKPSHYNDDGYVIRWWRALIPSNSLAAVYGLALDSAQRRVLGDDVEIDIDVIDETNTRVNVQKLIRVFASTIISACSVSSAYNRTSSRARSTSRGRSAPPASKWRWAVSMCPAASPCSTAPRSTSTLRATWASRYSPAKPRAASTISCATPPLGGCKPLYNYMNDLPGIGGAPIPFLPHEFVRAHRRHQCQFRRRPRLPVPVLVLHDHQRAGPQVALSHARRYRAHHARRTGSRTSRASSSPTTISRATRNGKRSSTGSRRCARSTRFRSA